MAHPPGYVALCKLAKRVGLDLEPFQREIARLALDPAVRELLVLLPRGNGRSSLVALLTPSITSSRPPAPRRCWVRPSSRRKAIRIATATEAAALLEALPAPERATWATAFHAGLRRGELQALRCSSIDLARSEIRVERSWDQYEGGIDPKSATSTRTVPLLAILRDYLDEHLLTSGRRGDDLAFGRTAADAFVPSTLRSRAERAWKAAGLARVTLHECRHTFASLLIAAGENPKAVQEFMGHAAITMTFDTYRHLFPGSRDEARERMDAYLPKRWRAGQRWDSDPAIQRPEATRGDRALRMFMRDFP